MMDSRPIVNRNLHRMMLLPQIVRNALRKTVKMEPIIKTKKDFLKLGTFLTQSVLWKHVNPIMIGCNLKLSWLITSPTKLIANPLNSKSQGARKRAADSHPSRKNIHAKILADSIPTDKYI